MQRSKQLKWRVSNTPEDVVGCEGVTQQLFDAAMEAGTLLVRTEHEAKPPTLGRKFSANLWLHMYDFRGPNVHGCDMGKRVRSPTRTTTARELHRPANEDEHEEEPPAAHARGERQQEETFLSSQLGTRIASPRRSHLTPTPHTSIAPRVRQNIRPRCDFGYLWSVTSEV